MQHRAFQVKPCFPGLAWETLEYIAACLRLAKLTQQRDALRVLGGWITMKRMALVLAVVLVACGNGSPNSGACFSPNDHLDDHSGPGPGPCADADGHLVFSDRGLMQCNWYCYGTWPPGAVDPNAQHLVDLSRWYTLTAAGTWERYSPWDQITKEKCCTPRR